MIEEKQQDEAPTGLKDDGNPDNPSITDSGQVGALADSESTGTGPCEPLEAGQRAATEQQQVEALQENLASLQRDRDEQYDRLLRKQAEFENFRKRTEKEKQEFYDFALAKFLLGLLPVIDGLERGLSVSEGETIEGYRRGIELILKQLRDLLSSAGVQPIRATGQMFDPNLHQAVLREESSVLPENEIIEEMQRGYTFKDRLLRPSMVKVSVPVPAPIIESVESQDRASEKEKDEEETQ